MKRLYFDCNSTAPLAPGLKSKICEWFDEDLKNPSSVHQDGQRAKAFIERARKSVLSALGAENHRLVFTSGGTEANNTVLASAYENRGERNKLLLTKIEHACVYNYAKMLESKGVELELLKVGRDGDIDLEDFANKLTENVFLVSVMLVQNETGFLMPVQKMAKMAHEKGILFHSDAVCAAGKWPINFAELGVDYLTFSSHKFGGLKGCGGIVVKNDAPLHSFILGGPHEAEKRAGTENLFGILSTSHALEVSTKELPSKIEKQMTLRKRLKQGIKDIYANAQFIEAPNNVPQTLSVSFVGLNGNVLLTNLDLEGISASYGSACASGSLEISRALTELGLSLEEARAALRFSFGTFTTEVDVEEFLVRLKRVIERME